MEKSRIPPGPPFLHWDVSERVAVFGHAVSDVLLTPRPHDPSPRRPESPTPLGQPSALGRSEGLRSAEPPSASNGATAFSRLCCSARALATPSRVPLMPRTSRWPRWPRGGGRHQRSPE